MISTQVGRAPRVGTASGERLRAAPRVVRGNGFAVAAAAFLACMVVAAIFAEWVAPYDPMTIDVARAGQGPGTPGHLLGTDSLGRDELSRLIFGARISLTVGVLSVAGSVLIGVTLGLIAGYYRGFADWLIMRTVDLQMGLPSLLIALLALYVLGPGILNVVLVLAITRWMVYARLVRGIMLSMRERQFFEGIVQLGASDARVIIRHALPNVLRSVGVLATLEMAMMMLLEASLDFLGLGVQPPTASWGLMLSEGKNYMTTAWWQVTLPGIAIALTALSLNILAARIGASGGRSGRRMPLPKASGV
ncbi:MAG: ABC transporter permease [Herbiconiux sp.]|uniref:ABC transporter permease n=1 Tax=Herbiconiux sp. TaxID=1871186 RepID=UPI0011F74B5C|nr:ABC transporter permease [Herbiconiux sp.]TAJ46929.1 MAG: ABC transporter permease [Herbiconiux sp.]